MTGVIRAAAELQQVCEEHRWQYCFIGGLALLRWGEPRETVDVDLILLTGFGYEQPFIDTLIARFEPRVADAAAFARNHRVLLLRTTSGVGLDIALSGLPFEEDVVRHATVFTYPPDVPLRTCSAEDLVVLKAFANRGKDWVDIEGVIVRQSAMDWSYIERQLAPLVELKDEPEILERLIECRRRCG